MVFISRPDQAKALAELSRSSPAAYDLTSLPPLAPSSSMPLYMQLAERLAAPIRAGRAAMVGHALPTETQCMAHFGVSRPTVRQAMAHLVSAGMVTRGRGRGTFVALERMSHDVSLAFEDEMRVARKAVRFQVLGRAIHAPPAAVADILGLPQGEDVVCLERLRLLDDQAFAHEVRFLPLAIGRQVTDRMAGEMAIISLLAAAMGQPPARITNIVSCVAAEARIAKLLGVRANTPLLQTAHTYFDADGAPLLHGVVCFHGERFQYTLDSPIEFRNDTGA
ncbi:GntR family transcriptional regulator [Humitalea sp. 24SJ18S-53]|uniref:GntR family transcriptional regulator n=1 Tax=Humitalea sp. 24SJ18S-53 TaxID=3422307 RepID=UPI003D67ED47